MNDKKNHEHLSKTHLATFLLISLCGLSYFAAVFNRGLNTAGIIEVMGADPQAIWTGEIWRLLTANFIHLNALHLFLNCFVLLSIGRIVEPLVGPARLLLIFLVSGVAGMAGSLLINSTLTAGASGSIFGLAGALIGARMVLPLRMVERQQLRAFTLLVLFNLMLGIAANYWMESGIQIDNAAHATGLLFGLLLGLAFCLDYLKVVSPRQKMVANATLCFSAFLFFSLCISALKPTFLPTYHLYVAHHYLELQQPSEAAASIAWLEKDDDYRGYGQVLNGRKLLMENQSDQAEKYFLTGLSQINANPSQALSQVLAQSGFKSVNDALFFDEKGNVRLCMIALSSSNPHQDILNNCAWLLLTARDSSLRNPQLALSWVRQAVNTFDSAGSEIFHTLAEAYAQTGDTKEALIATQRAKVAQSQS